MADKSVTIRMDSLEYERIEAMWKQAGFGSLQEAGLHAYRTAFETGPDQVQARYRPQMKQLVEILRSGDKETIDAVMQNLRVFAKHVRALRELTERGIKP